MPDYLLAIVQYLVAYFSCVMISKEIMPDSLKSVQSYILGQFDQMLIRTFAGFGRMFLFLSL